MLLARKDEAGPWNSAAIAHVDIVAGKREERVTVQYSASCSVTSLVDISHRTEIDALDTNLNQCYLPATLPLSDDHL